VALSKSDLKLNPLVMGHEGVKFDKTGRDILDATYLIQLHDEKYRLAWLTKRPRPN
jgi:branched-chain amino acid transport system substrate-binding protein